MQRSVIQPLWVAVNGAEGEWKKGAGDGPPGPYRHVGDYMFRRNDGGTLGNRLYRWTPKEDKLQSVLLTRATREALDGGLYDTGVDFDATSGGAQNVTNLTLYGLQHLPMRWIEYDTRQGTFTFHDMEEGTVEPLRFPPSYDRSKWREHGVKYQGEKYYAMEPGWTGLEGAGKILFYLKEFKQRAAAQQPDADTVTGIPAAGQKQISERVTRNNVLLWEPIKKRGETQKSVMGGASAADEARAVGIAVADGKDWHWCHLIAHSMGTLGNPQIERNLVAGTAACNGAMAHLEVAVKSYVKETGKDLHVMVTARLIGTSHVAEKITYKVEEPTVGGRAIFYFDPLNPNKSAVQYADYYASVLADKLNVGTNARSSSQRSELLRSMTDKKHFTTPQKVVTVEPTSPLLTPSISNLFSQSNPSPPTSPYTPTTSQPGGSQDSGHVTDAIAQGHVVVNRGKNEHKKHRKTGRK